MKSTIESINFLELLMQGGMVMIPIILLSMVSVYFISERFMFIKQRAVSNHSLVNKVVVKLREGNKEAATAICDSESTAVANTIGAGLAIIGRPIPEIEAMMESQANIEIAEMERNLNYLGLIAGVAPMLGFIGTISGVIKIFYSISLSDNISIGIIASGLYEKMISSGSGLIVGLIAYTGYQLLNNKIDRVTLALQKQSLQFLQQIQQ